MSCGKVPAQISGGLRLILVLEIPSNLKMAIHSAANSNRDVPMLQHSVPRAKLAEVGMPRAIFVAKHCSAESSKPSPWDFPTTTSPQKPNSLTLPLPLVP